MKCQTCGEDRRPTRMDHQQQWDADLYDGFVAENRELVTEVAEFIVYRTVENDHETNHHCRYEWGESEAVAILESWEDLKEIVDGPRKSVSVFREYR